MNEILKTIWLQSIPFLAAMVFAPLVPGVINRTKAFYAGRRGQSVFQSYYDIWKLLQKSSVYSRTTTWIFRVAPFITLSCCVIALMMVSPFGVLPGSISFPGDIIFLAYILAFARFFTVLAALDTGSSFEGMGASREVQFALFAEVAFFISLVVVACMTRSLSIAGMQSLVHDLSVTQFPVVILVSVSLFIVLLAENSRIPVDDPNTHLELTMIHEVMVLDYSGPDFALILYGATLKLWLFCSIIVSILIPVKTGQILSDVLLFATGMLLAAILIGSVESVMARFRFDKVPRLLICATVLAVLGLLLSLGGGL